MIHIRVTKGPDKGEQIKTRQGVVSVGRWADCDLVLKDNKVSHLHGEFLYIGARCLYRDLLSRNGSFVRSGGETIWLGPLKSDWEVKSDDEIILGNTTILVEAVTAEAAQMSRGDEGDYLGTMSVDANHQGPHEEVPLAAQQIAQLRAFLDLPSLDATSMQETRAAICDALAKVFPDAAYVVLIDLLPGCGEQLQPGSIDIGSVVFAPRRGADQGVEAKYSFHILAQTYAQKKPLFYGTGTSLPDAPSVLRRTMDSCVCLPLWRVGAIHGFLQIHTIAGQGRPLTRRDTQLLCLLGTVASLLINRAADAEQRSRWRAAAAAGEAVSGLSHDARPVLDALGKNMIGVEQGFPALAQDPSWQFVKQDLVFLRQITRDAIRRARTGLGDLQPREVALRVVADEVLDMCQRYFLDQAHRADVKLVNACRESHRAVIDQPAVQQVLVNCVKNSLCVLHEAWRRHEKRSGTIQLVSGDDFDAPRRFCLMSVCDDAGGIPCGILDQLGNPFVTGENRQGMGLGVYLVADIVGRLGGQVRIATSTEPQGTYAPGTVVSFSLPKTEEARLAAVEAIRPRLTIIPDYAQYRAGSKAPTCEEIDDD